MAFVMVIIVIFGIVEIFGVVMIFIVIFVVVAIFGGPHLSRPIYSDKRPSAVSFP